MSLMKSNPKISIVMPMYRVERYIEKAIQSVLNQDFQDWELLVVNDGSPDGSRDIASLMAASDERIKILDKENGGLSDARNYGLDRAIGEFVHFYDSDDWIEPDFYSRLLNEIDDYDLVVCGYKVDTETTITERNGYSGELSEVVGNSLSHLVGAYLNFAWNKLFRRFFLIENALYYEKGLYRIEDSEFMKRFLSYAPKVKMIEYTGYHYMVRNTSTLSNLFDEKIFEHLSRSISIHSNIFRALCKDDDIICNELGRMSLNATKSVLYKVLEDVSFYNIRHAKYLINRIVNDEIVCNSIKGLRAKKTADKIIYSSVINKRWWLLFFVTQLKKYI